MGSDEPGPCLTDKRAFGSQSARFLVTVVVCVDVETFSFGRKLGRRFDIPCQTVRAAGDTDNEFKDENGNRGSADFADC